MIAEDETDSDALAMLIRRIRPGVGVTPRHDGGCSAILRKAERWMQNLALVGCTAMIIVHDLDHDHFAGKRRDEKKLRAALSAIPVVGGLPRHVCVPVEEIEAWFWSDEAIIKRLSGGKKHAHPNPHAIVSPKEELMRISRDAGKKPRYSTSDNEKLAEKLDLVGCAKVCPAFADFQNFVLAS
ncbi:MAG TPA: DUF4276 family protein [Polyangiaceae bacterium]